MLRILACQLALAVVAFGADDTFNWKGKVAAGQRVEIKGINGDVRAEPSTTGEVEVVAVKSGRKNDPREVKVEVVPHASGVTICAVYPSPDSTPNECRPDKGGRMSVRDNDVKVMFTVKVPAAALFVARTVNGNVAAKGLEGGVEARTVNGRVDVQAKGNVEAETVNGSIDAAMGDASWSGLRRLATVNGGITVHLPANASADVRAETVNGSIDSEFPLTVQGKFANRRLRGTIGSGGRELTMKTVNGSIRLRKT